MESTSRYLEKSGCKSGNRNNGPELSATVDVQAIDNAVRLFRAGGRRGGAVLAGLLIGCWPAAGAEPAAQAGDRDLTELSLEELGTLKVSTVYGASKHEQKTSEAPSSVSIVTAEDIQEYGYRTLADVLRAARGFYVSYNRAYDFIGVRGFNRPGDFGGRVLIMIDGHRLNDPIYDSNFAGTEFPLDMDMVDKIEIIRGPGSVLYGNNAFFGVVNVITRRGSDLHGVELSGSYGSFDTYTGRLSYGNRFTNGVEFALSGTVLESEGPDRLYFPEFRSNNGGVADHLDGTETKDGFASLSYHDFSIEGGYVDRIKYTPTAPYGTLFNDPNTMERDRKAFADLKFNHQFENELALSARLYFDHYRYDSFLPYSYDYEVPPVPGLQTINRDMDIAQSYGTEVQLSRTFFDQHHVTLGGEFRWDTPLEMRNTDDDPAATWLAIKEEQEVGGIYLQDEYRILENLILNAGGRYDNYSSFGDTINPRVALIYSPWQTTTFKWLYGEAYRAPNVAEWGYIGPGWTNSPGLRAETIDSYEMVWEQSLNRNLSLSASVFLNQVHGLIDATSRDDLQYYANLEDAESRGFEVGLEGRWEHGLRGSVSYTYADANYDNSPQPLSNSPRHMAKLNLAVPVWREKIFAGFEIQGMSSRLTELGNETAGFAVANLTLFSRQLVKNMDFSASVYNILDKRYWDPGEPGLPEDSLEQDGRTFRIKLTYRF